MADITIPRAALEAGITAFAEAEVNDYTSQAEDLATAFLAMLTAWPNRVTVKDDGRRQTYIIPAIILPLPTENPDAEA